MCRNTIKNAVLCAVTAAVTGGALPSWAQLEEVVVTAQRREEAVQDIPLAVSAFSEEQIERLQIQETLDVARLIPNFIGHNNTGLGTGNTYSIRGLNNTESIATFDPPVGSYIDDTFIQRQNANNFAFFDIDRIEVSRGPQGTLFGRNTTGGAVRVILKKPAEELGGFLEAGYGEFDRMQFRGSVDLPVSDRVLTKFSAYYIEDDGFVDNRSGTGGANDLNFEESIGVRGALRFLLTPDVTWDVALSYNNTEHANILNFDDNGTRFSNSGLATGALVGLLTGNKATLPGNSNEVESVLFQSDLSWDLGFGTLNFITSYLTLDQEFNLDFTNAPGDIGGFVIANDGEHDQFTQEVKLTGSLLGDRVDYVAGFFYFDEENETDFGDSFGGFILADRVLKNNTESWAIYSQFDYHLNDKWTATAGIRYTEEDKDVSFNGVGTFGAPLNDSLIEAEGIERDQTQKAWTPRFALQYQPTDNFQMYLAATKGFKSGGWNARGTSARTLLPFGPETVWNYEAGVKSEWFDNRLRVNVAGFINDVQDFQLPSAFVPPGGGAPVFITGNFADLEIKGLETEILATPIDPLTIWVNVGFQDASYKNLSDEVMNQLQGCLTMGTRCGEGIVTLDGGISEPVRAPDYTVTVGGSYEIPLGGSLTLTPSITATYTGDHTTGTSNLPGSTDISYSNVNAGVTLAPTSGNWSIILDCRNCTDQEQFVSQLADLNYLNDPMRWGIRGRYNF